MPARLRRPMATAGLVALAMTASLVAPQVVLASQFTVRPVAIVQSDHSVGVDDLVFATIMRVSSARAVVVTWGDGSHSSVTGGCSARQASQTPRKCGMRVTHAYDRAGNYGVSIGWASATIATASIHVIRAGTARWEQTMLDRVNALRAEAGVPAVLLCPPLESSAQKYARVMASLDYYGHVGPDGRQPWDRMRSEGYAWKGAAENIAAGQDDLAAVMAAWRGSAGHYANMVNPDYRHVGFGFSRDAASTYSTYWVQHFGYGGDCSP